MTKTDDELADRLKATADRWSADDGETALSDLLREAASLIDSQAARLEAAEAMLDERHDTIKRLSADRIKWLDRAEESLKRADKLEALANAVLGNNGPGWDDADRKLNLAIDAYLTTRKGDTEA